MAIRIPGARLLRDLPFTFIDKGGRRRRPVDAQIALIPFVDFLMTIVVFLLMSFSASGEIPMAATELPEAENVAPIERAPIVAIDSEQVTVDSRRVAGVRDLGADASLSRIEPLVHDLEVARANWQLLHPGEEWTPRVIVQADRQTDFRVLRKVMFSVAQAGYTSPQLAVRER